MSAIKGYLLSISACALLSSIVLSIIPKSNVKKIANLIGMLLIVLAAISPLVKIKAEDIAKSIAMIEIETEEIRTGVEINNREILAEVIQNRCETYILDKAELINADISVKIILSEEGGYPYPVGVLIEGAVTAEARAYLESIIEQDIGILPEKQEWRG